MKKYIALSLCIAWQISAMLPSQKIRKIFNDKKLADFAARGENKKHQLRISLISTEDGECIQFVQAWESENDIHSWHDQEKNTVQKLKTHLQSRLNSDLSPNQKLFFAIALQDTESFKTLLDNGATGDSVHFENETDYIFGPPNDNALFYLAHLIQAYEREGGAYKTKCMEMLQLACAKSPHLMESINLRNVSSPASILSNAHECFKERNSNQTTGYELYKMLRDK